MLITRQEKGSALTYAEMDENLTTLKTDMDNVGDRDKTLENADPVAAGGSNFAYSETKTTNPNSYDGEYNMFSFQMNGECIIKYNITVYCSSTKFTYNGQLIIPGSFLQLVDDTYALPIKDNKAPMLENGLGLEANKISPQDNEALYARFKRNSNGTCEFFIQNNDAQTYKIFMTYEIVSSNSGVLEICDYPRLVRQQ